MKRAVHKLSEKQKQKAESHQKILKAASSLFKKNGYSATGVDQIMAEAGLTAGAFYAHFKSKKDLLNKSIKFSLSSNREVLLGGLEGLKGRDLIATVLSRYASEVHRDRPQEGCPIVGIASELQRHSSVAGSEIQKYLEEWVKLLAPHLQKNISEEKKRMEILGLLSQAVGALLLARLTKNSKLSSEILESCRVSII